MLPPAVICATDGQAKHFMKVRCMLLASHQNTFWSHLIEGEKKQGLLFLVNLCALNISTLQGGCNATHCWLGSSF